MPTSGNQSTRQRNLPIVGKDSAWSQQCFSCGMVQGCSELPTHIAISHAHHCKLFWDLNRIKTGQGPFSLAELKTHDEVLSAFWKQQGLVIYSWSITPLQNPIPETERERLFALAKVICLLSGVPPGLEELIHQRRIGMLSPIEKGLRSLTILRYYIVID